MKKSATWCEAKRLHALGFAVHYLHPKSKRPLENGWTSGQRKTGEELHATYKNGYNIGVRTGRASSLVSGFLACIDVDVKDPIYRKEALDKLKELIGDQICPEVRSGSDAARDARVN